MTEKPHTETIQAKHEFTQVERLELADKLTEAMRQRGELESQLSSIKKDFGGRIEALEVEASRIAGKIESRFEMRDTLAIVLFGFPAPNRKSFYFADALKNPATGEYPYVPGPLIREESMTHADLQRTLPLEEKPEKPEKPILSGQSKDVPPAGFALVTEGDSRDGDACFRDGAWVPIFAAGQSASLYAAMARPVNADAGTTPVGEVLTQAAKKARKPRAKFEQPPGKVSVGGREENYLVLDLSGVQTETGITQLFRAAARQAKWPTESFLVVLNAHEPQGPEAYKAALAHYTYQPEAAE